MAEIPPIPLSVPETAARSAPASPARQSPVSRAGSPAFEALLERLEARAAEVEHRSRTLTAPAELPAALDAARASLEDALNLGEELLEAYRAACRAPEPRT